LENLPQQQGSSHKNKSQRKILKYVKSQPHLPNSLSTPADKSPFVTQPTNHISGTDTEREREVLPDQQKGSPLSCFWIVPTETLPAENLTKCYKVCTPQTWETFKLSKKPAIDFLSQDLQWKEETYPPFCPELDALCLPSIVSRALYLVEPMDWLSTFVMQSISRCKCNWSREIHPALLLIWFFWPQTVFVFKENKRWRRETVVCCREESKSQPYEWGRHQWPSCWFSGKAHIAPLPHSHWLANNTPKPITGIAMKNLLPKSSNSPKSQRLPPKCVKCREYFKGEALQWIRLLKNSNSTKSANCSREDFLRERGCLPNLFGAEMRCYTKFIRKQKLWLCTERSIWNKIGRWVERREKRWGGLTYIHAVSSARTVGSS
jgi:hypothetical protein